MRKKRFHPKKIEDLVDLYYNKECSENKLRYEDCIDSKIINRSREEEATKILAKLGKSEKISRKDRPTPDYLIRDSKIVYEITSIQISKEERSTQNVNPRSEQNFIADIDDKIEHALQKDYSEYQNYLKGVIIFIDEILISLTDYGKYLAQPPLINQTTFKNSNIDFMILVPTPHFTNNKSMYVAYVKDEKLCKLFKERLQPRSFKVILVKNK